ncbi:MAG: IPT/TIG domain-containing protein [Candidatus Kapabacteria bacterium]|nr:IPT/TIG domain-containing protein [Candidatus Kapabacteria bacterium]
MTSFSPRSGGQETVLIVTGANLAGVHTVLIGGMPVRSFTVLSSTAISVIVGPVTTGPIQVGSPLGGAASSDVFTFFPSPLISSVLPNAAGAGAVVRIRGTFGGGLIGLTIGGIVVPEADLVSHDDGSISVRVPARATNATIVLSTPGGTVVSTNALTFVGVPRLLSFTPAVAATGAVVTIIGEHFVSGASVYFGRVPARSATVNNTHERRFPPQDAPTLTHLLDKQNASLSSHWIRSVFITVRTPGGVTTSATQFVYNHTPSLGDIDPLDLL